MTASKQIQDRTAYQLPCVHWITPDDGHRRCPKRVWFFDKNRFWILMHLVGYFYETYHDARSPEHKVEATSVSHYVSKHKDMHCLYVNAKLHV
jgi:hypothetical protein